MLSCTYNTVNLQVYPLKFLLVCAHIFISTLPMMYVQVLFCKWMISRAYVMLTYTKYFYLRITHSRRKYWKKKVQVYLNFYIVYLCTKLHLVNGICLRQTNIWQVLRNVRNMFVMIQYSHMVYASVFSEDQFQYVISQQLIFWPQGKNSTVCDYILA